MEQSVHEDNSFRTNNAEPFENSNDIRLSARQWLFVGIVIAAFFLSAPALWDLFEEFSPGSDYRIPYALGSDYRLYSRYSSLVLRWKKIPVIGDSVVWGHYVSPGESLSHHLNEIVGRHRFANLGLDGTHPAALEGLVAYYVDHIPERRAVLHFNPLWITSAKHDLQTAKEFHFNHPGLVPQFTTEIPCYKASTSVRVWNVVEHHVPFLAWTTHLKLAYFGGADLQRWTLDHPYEIPWDAMKGRLPELEDAAPEKGSSWIDRGARRRDLEWVDPDRSLQWRFFRDTVEGCRERKNSVFVLVGPFNEHMLTERAGERYTQIKGRIKDWLEEKQVPHFIAEPLPSRLYADLSHPLAEGYALLAKRLFDDPAFRSFALEAGE